MKKEEFKPTKVMTDAALQVFACQAMIRAIQPIIKQMDSMILKDMKIPFLKTSDESAEYITDSKKMYLVSEKDAQRYFDRYDAEKDKAGFEKYGKGICPLLAEEDKLRIAERQLIDIMEPISKISFDMLSNNGDFLSNYAKLVNLNLNLLAPFVKIKK